MNFCAGVQKDEVGSGLLHNHVVVSYMLLYRKFIQDNVCQILPESTGFCGRHDKNILVFIAVHSVAIMSLLESVIGRLVCGAHSTTWWARATSLSGVIVPQCKDNDAGQWRGLKFDLHHLTTP